VTRRHAALCVGPVRTNCYLVWPEGGSDCAVIDPGDDAPAILNALAQNGLTPQYILLTHGHFDHVGALRELRERYPEARTAIHAADSAKLNPDILIEDGEVCDAGGLRFRYLHTPGHTKGSGCWLCGDALYSGDTLFFEECGRCDLPGGSFAEMLRSLKRLSELEGDLLVYPGHDRASDLRHEREHNPYMLQAVGA
jgi:glyoxylase-like metal-dependent hydrolase (beta-lactamase superfamily II)